MRESKSPYVLEADAVGKSFWSREVLKAASLRVPAGKIVGLLGRNGVGKTTLLRIIVGRTLSSHGRILFDGQHYAWPRLSELSRKGLLYLSQDASLSDLFPVGAHLEAYRTCYWLRQEDVDQVVERLSLEALLDQKPSTLSGGEKQRVAMALALLRKPRCLLTDEPFSGVAPKDRPLISQTLEELSQDGCGVVITGHDVEEIFEVSDSIFWMVAGTTHEFGSPGEARESFQFRREYLGPRLEDSTAGG